MRLSRDTGSSAHGAAIIARNRSHSGPQGDKFVCARLPLHELCGELHHLGIGADLVQTIEQIPGAVQVPYCAIRPPATGRRAMVRSRCEITMRDNAVMPVLAIAARSTASTEVDYGPVAPGVPEATGQETR